MSRRSVSASRTGSGTGRTENGKSKMTDKELLREAKGDPVFAEDLLRIAHTALPYEELKEKKILVTGATGLVGQAVVRALLTIARECGVPLTVYALCRDREKTAALYKELLERPALIPVYGDVRDAELPDDTDIVIHAASPTASRFFVAKPVETMEIAIGGTKNMLEQAKRTGAEMVYISSMEAFGVTDPEKDRIREEDLGFIDLTSVRSCYPESKRVCELLCASYYHEYGVKAVSARLAQTFGAGVDVSEGRVFAQFAKSAMADEDIVLHTKGESWGNYCYTADAVTGIFTILLKGEPGTAYTVVNPSTSIRIRDMAELAAEKLSGGRSSVVFDIPEDSLKFGYAPDVKIKLSADRLMGLGWQPQVDLPEMYERLAASFRHQTGH